MHFTCVYLGSENVQIPVYCMMVIHTSLRSVQSEFWGDTNLEITYLIELVENMHVYLVTMSYLRKVQI